MAKTAQYYGTGRRKEASARVFLKLGKGQIKVNDKTSEDFFGKTTDWLLYAFEPLDRVGARNLFDVFITVSGGGVTGQAGAIRLGISRALVTYEQAHPGKTSLPEDRPLPESLTAQLTRATSSEEESEAALAKLAEINQRLWHVALRKEGYLTRDPRAVLRKLVGLMKSAKAKQFSKR
jgi:small subunit ribosomal protein S9